MEVEPFTDIGNATVAPICPQAQFQQGSFQIPVRVAPENYAAVPVASPRVDPLKALGQTVGCAPRSCPNRFGWIGGALMPALQPARLVAGFLIALAIWLPGLGWDAMVGPTIDPTGILAEPLGDSDQAAIQATLRRLAGDYAPDAIFEGARVPARELAAVLEASAQQAPDRQSREILLMAAAHADSMAPLGTFEALVLSQSRAASTLMDGITGASPSDLMIGVRLAVWEIPTALWGRDPVFTVVFGLWCVLVLAVGAGALARMEAVQAAGKGTLSAGQGLAFAANRWAELVLAWLAPLGIAAVLALLCVAWGLLFRLEFTAWVGAVLYGIPLVIGTIAGLALAVWALGLALAPAAVVCDGLDALDASQRGAAYAIGRPAAWLACAAIVVVVSSAGLVVVRAIAWVITAFTATTVGMGASLGSSVDSAPVALEYLRFSPDPTVSTWGGPAIATHWWMGVASALVAGAFLSLLAGLLTRAYLCLRERCDGQEIQDIWPFEFPTDVSDRAAPQSP